MNPYILIIIADIFLAMNFVFQKKYQRTAGTSVKAGLVYNALMGAFSAIMFLFINKFEIEITTLSLVMALAFATVVMLYIFAGFRIMEKGNMALYTLFLMSGGMTVPYIWGVLFLNEELTILRTLGLIAIILAIVISNSGTKRPDKKQLMLCIAVFFLNGASSVISKMHQINEVSKIVTSPDFAFLVMMIKTVICTVILLAGNNKFTLPAGKKLSFKVIIPIILLSAIADGLTYMLQLIGATQLPATVLYPFVTGGSIILTTIAGMLIFKEKLTSRQWIGIVLCFAGTLLFL